MSEVLPFLYLGNRLNASCEVQLRKYGIQRILAIHDRPIPNYEDKHPFVKKYKFIKISDTVNADISKVFGAANEFIQDARDNGENILVHCLMGQSRSATIVAAYVATIHRLDGSTALQFVRQRRKQANPNVGFILQLNDYTKKIASEPPVNGYSKINDLLQNDRIIINKFCPFAVPD